MNIFIGGSRAVSKLNAALRARLDEVVINPGHTVLIGDANGADKAVQQYLAQRQYSKVVVFCMDSPRNNIGAWPTRTIDPPSGKRDFAYYAAKDSVMAKEAKCGLMLWDGKSKGTLNNILNLTGEGKRTLVYFSPTKAFYVLGNENDLQALLARCEKGYLEIAARGLGLKTPLSQTNLPLSPA
jgi:hypothetical protein